MKNFERIKSKEKWLPLVLSEQTLRRNHFNNMTTEPEIELIVDGQRLKVEERDGYKVMIRVHFECIVI